ncbi:LptF/LptG family permease, partial [Cryobacterium sp. 10S3]
VLAIPLGFVNPRVGRSANLIVALLTVIIYLNVVNISQATVAQGRTSFALSWWPVHLLILLLVLALFLWRLKVNSRWHPLVLWSNCKA